MPVFYGFPSEIAENDTCQHAGRSMAAGVNYVGGSARDPCPVQDGSTERGWALWQNHVSVFFALEPFGESVVLLSCDGAVHAGQKNAFSGAEDSLL